MVVRSQSESQLVTWFVPGLAKGHLGYFSRDLPVPGDHVMLADPDSPDLRHPQYVEAVVTHRVFRQPETEHSIQIHAVLVEPAPPQFMPDQEFVEDLLAYLDLHLSRHQWALLTTEQKEVMADLIDASGRRKTPEGPRLVERWWR